MTYNIDFVLPFWLNLISFWTLRILIHAQSWNFERKWSMCSEHRTIVRHPLKICYLISVPFLNDDYDYYYDDEELPYSNNNIEMSPKYSQNSQNYLITTTAKPPLVTSRWPSIRNRESFTQADAKIRTTTWSPLTFDDNTQSNTPFIPSPTSDSNNYASMNVIREPIRSRVTTESPNYVIQTTTQTTTTTRRPITTTTTKRQSGYRFKKPEDVEFDGVTSMCSLEDLCDVTEKNYPL